MSDGERTKGKKTTQKYIHNFRKRFSIFNQPKCSKNLIAHIFFSVLRPEEKRTKQKRRSQETQHGSEKKQRQKIKKKTNVT